MGHWLSVLCRGPLSCNRTVGGHTKSSGSQRTPSSLDGRHSLTEGAQVEGKASFRVTVALFGSVLADRTIRFVLFNQGVGYP